jgi:hypothetical protein
MERKKVFPELNYPETYSNYMPSRPFLLEILISNRNFYLDKDALPKWNLQTKGVTMKFFLLLTLIFSALSLFAADIFNHEIKTYPRTKECSEIALELAEKFHNVASVEVYWAGVTTETKETCDIKISYLNNQRLEIVRNIDTDGIEALQHGTQATLENCVGGLEREKELFRNLTGLEPWIAYCFKENSLLNPYPWVAKVEAFGQPALRLFSTQTISFLSPSQPWKAVFNEAWRNGKRNEIDLVSVIGRPYIMAGDSEITIRYYGTKRLHLNFSELANHTESSTCEKQITKLSEELFQSQTPPLAVFCGQESKEVFKLGIFALSEGILGLGNLKVIEDPKGYGSYDACRAELPTAISFYKTKLNKNILSGMCGNKVKERFEITLFEELKPQP